MAPSYPADAVPHVTYSRQFRRCNKPGCSTCVLGSPGHGPYWYASWREGGRRRTRYVGKQLPPEAAITPEPAAVAAAAGYPPLRVRTLGGFSVWQGGNRLPDDAWVHRKATMLFKCLLSVPQHRLHCERLADLLGLADDPAASVTYLRTIRHRLRTVLGQRGRVRGYLYLEGELLALQPSPDDTSVADWLDAEAFEFAAAAALAGGDAIACRSALALYGGEYLPDDPYDEWAVTRREELRQQYLAVLLRLADLRERDGVLAEAARCLRGVLAIDPCYEQAARSLMRVQLAAGVAHEAVRTYQQVTAALLSELDMTPEQETKALYQAALAGRRSTDARTCNLPTLFTSFLGREQELEALAQLLDARRASPPAAAYRLLTVIGSGGCGKTRLAIELGHEVRTSYPDGPWLVEFAAMEPGSETDPERIARQLADVVGLHTDRAQSSLPALVAFLQSQRALVILDNCEHMIPASASFVLALLRECPNTHILATSREALGVLGERVWRLPSLKVPPGTLDSTRTLQQIGQYAAVRLLIERARLVQPGFALTVDNCRAVVAICRQLDGIPLALELAASRLGQLSASDLAARLQDRFRLLTAGNRTALPRQQTLLAVMEWSYGLLTGDERALLRILSVFAGGCTLDAVEAVCSDSPLEESLVSDLVARLASKSLLQVEDLPETPGRYRLLETVRHYAGQRLQEHGEELQARQRHLGWCLSLAERAASAMDGPEQVLWLDRLEAEHDNLRAALAWSIRESGAVDAALRLAAALWLFWSYRGHWTEGRSWLAAALARERGDAGARLRALRAVAALAENQCDYHTAREAQQECLALAHACQDTFEVANALNGLGNIARFENNFSTAAVLYEESLTISHQDGSGRGIARALHNLALIAEEEGDYSRAIALYDESLTHRRQRGDGLAAASTQYNQAICYRLAGDLNRAAAVCATLLPQFEAFGDRWSVAAVHNELGRIASEQGQHHLVATHLNAGLRAFRELGDVAASADVLENWAVALARQGNPAPAARMLGAVAAAHTAIGYRLPPGLQQVFLADVALTRALLGADDIFDAGFVAGQVAPVDEIIADLFALVADDLPA